MTIGEDRVRIKFNPSDKSVVGHIKQKTAELIDLCDQHRAAPETEFEECRSWQNAAKDYESAAMWAVKAATTPQ